MEGVLQEQSTEAFVQSSDALLRHDRPETIGGPLVASDNRHNPEASVGVVNDGACALQVEAVEYSLQGKQHSVCQQVASERSNQLRVVSFVDRLLHCLLISCLGLKRRTTTSIWKILFKILDRLLELTYTSTRPDQTRPDQTRPDQTRPDQTRPDQTRPDQTRPDQTVL